MADQFFKEFTLRDGSKITLDMYRMTAKQLSIWASFRERKLRVPNTEVLKAIAIATESTVEALEAMPVPEFLPISNQFNDWLMEMLPKVTAPDPN